ncbi:hypothetical protein NCR96_09115 [Helicobacter sp. 14348-15]|uniref:hypothetical protein n=1 Tax=Helicobacter colisuis TaxID=2949739 RepID=UPI00202B625C|nr:hypothetical protein [Helicobacter colisuis]MCL9821893.1 hypothetical protein [Helicobacter colisuis]
MIFNEIEFQEKTRLKREKRTSMRLPILVTEKQTMEYGKKVDKTYFYIKRDEKTFVYLGKKTFYLYLLDEVGNGKFHITWVDLVSPQDLLDLQDEDFQAFGVFLPKNIILEVLDFHKNHKDAFSLLVKKYPFAQLVFSQWLTIKLYERHKELTKNPNLEYQKFLQEHFTFTFNHKSYDIFNALSMLETQEVNYRNDEEFNIIDTATALDSNSSNYITLYDFIYDIIPNSIRKVFLKDIETMKAYLPLKQERFFYQEREYQDPEEVFKGLYGSDKTYNESKVPKEYYQINALTLKDYEIKSLIPKAKSNKLGIGYDELWEMVSKNEKDLEYPEIWEFKIEEAPELDEYDTDMEGNKFLLARYCKDVLDYKFQSSWKDIIKLQKMYSPYADSYLELYGGEVWDRGTGYVTSEENQKIAAKQYFDSIALIMQNNFHTDYTIFESTRQKMKQNKDIAFDSVTLNSRYGCAVSCFEASALKINTFIAYRFNQALALAFLNAYRN